MTILNKSVHRETNTTTRQGRTLMLEIRPGATDLIVVREKGRRKGYAVPIERIFLLGARLEADEQRKITAQKRNDRKAGKNGTK
jgi:hypothetical protein